MNNRVLTTAAVCAALLTMVLLGTRMARVDAQEAPGVGFAAIPGLKGGQDIFGPYDVVPNWPRPMSESLPVMRTGPIR